MNSAESPAFPSQPQAGPSRISRSGKSFFLDQIRKVRCQCSLRSGVVLNLPKLYGFTVNDRLLQALESVADAILFFSSWIATKAYKPPDASKRPWKALGQTLED